MFVDVCEIRFKILCLKVAYLCLKILSNLHLQMVGVQKCRERFNILLVNEHAPLACAFRII